MNEKFIIQICENDGLYIVCVKSTGTDYVYRTVAECQNRKSAELLREALIKADKEK